ncbi:MAG TPA: hypothetical protein VFW71_01610 [Actinomycetota bacterium]|nr:hypothetical protein [Actinomycetota bacterium]
MSSVRRLAAGTAFLTWIFCYSLLHDAEQFYSHKQVTKGLPGWLVVVLGLSLFITIATAVSALIKLPLWPWLAMAGGLIVVGATLATHWAALHSAATALRAAGSPHPAEGFGAAVRESLKAGVLPVFFSTAAPVVLVATGLMGWRWGPRHLFAVEPGTGPGTGPGTEPGAAGA